MKTISKNNIFINKRGFTLVESLVAISVLLIGVLGPLVLATRAISDGISTKNKVTASYLAQGELEAIRAMRDYNINIGASSFWNNNFDFCVNLNNGCIVKNESSRLSLYKCNTIADCQITLGSGPTFTKKIIITSVNSTSAKVNITVTWDEKGAPKSYSLNTALFVQ